MTQSRSETHSVAKKKFGRIDSKSEFIYVDRNVTDAEIQEMLKQEMMRNSNDVTSDRDQVSTSTTIFLKKLDHFR